MNKKQIEFCKARNITENQFFGVDKIGGSLYLEGLTAIPEGFNPTVGVSLNLEGLTAIPKGFNPTVGVSLYLEGLTAIPEGFNPTVGGSLYLRGLTAPTKQLPDNFKQQLELNLTWEDGKYRIIDGIFCEILSEKKNVIKVKTGNEIVYIINVDGVYSHGKTIKEARESLIYKISNRDTSPYDNMTVDTILTVAESIKMYRVITGACEFGTKHFVKMTDIKKKKYTIKEIMEITSGQYGYDKLTAFFSK
jgi:hypothetical protein